MDTGSFIVYIKTVDAYKEIGETRCDTLNYELDKPLLTRKNKNVIGLIKDELRGKIKRKICWTKSKILYLLNRWQ